MSEEIKADAFEAALAASASEIATPVVEVVEEIVAEVVSELRKVVWPTRNQLTTYTAVVLVFVSFIIAVVSLIDLVLGRLVFWVFG